MIVPLSRIKEMKEFAGKTDEELTALMEAVEAMIRSKTHNNFQNRAVRFSAGSCEGILQSCSPFLQEGDTVQITESFLNDGLYTIAETGGGITKTDKKLLDTCHNLVTKVEYPADVQLGAINLMKYEVTYRKKAGIKSETLSRHSVSYFDQDASNQDNGYPVSLMGFLRPYMKARF